MTTTENTVTHTTVTRYKYSSPETHGHTGYQEALEFAHSRLNVNPTGSVSVQLNRLEADKRYPDGIHELWIETLGGVR